MNLVALPRLYVGTGNTNNSSRRSRNFKLFWYCLNQVIHKVSKPLLTVYGAQHLLRPIVVCTTFLPFAIPQIYGRYVPGRMFFPFIRFADGEKNSVKLHGTQLFNSVHENSGITDTVSVLCIVASLCQRLVFEAAVSSGFS